MNAECKISVAFEGADRDVFVCDKEMAESANKGCYRYMNSPLREKLMLHFIQVHGVLLSEKSLEEANVRQIENPRPTKEPSVRVVGHLVDTVMSEGLVDEDLADAEEFAYGLDRQPLLVLKD